MKNVISKIFSVMTMFIMSASMVSCTAYGKGTTAKVITKINTLNQKSIVVYFSNTGNTENIAQDISNNLGADIYKIVPKNEYTSDDLKYSNSSSRATREQNDENVRPEIVGEKIDLSQYDNVFIGYPLWWGQAPRVINTFIETYDLTGKNIVPFCTSHSSGIEASVNEMKQKYPQINWKEGKRFPTDTTKEQVSEWLYYVNKK